MVAYILLFFAVLFPEILNNSRGPVNDPNKRHLLVDGSNIMHAWPELRTLLARDRNAARSRVSLAVAPLHDIEHVRVTLVFDGSGDKLAAELPSGQATFAHLHTPAGTTADEIIVQLVRQSKAPERCLVATGDRGVRAAIEGLGAAAISAADLAGWARRADERQVARAAHLGRANDKEWRRGPC